MGRLHRHNRPADDRPAQLNIPVCYVRGIAEWSEGSPTFSSGVNRVYESASLLETLAVLGLNSLDSHAQLRLPEDIAPMVRQAYAEDIQDLIPQAWQQGYHKALNKRANNLKTKQSRAKPCLLKSAYHMCWSKESLVDWYSLHLNGGTVQRSTDEDQGQRAVRDTQETVEVLILEERDDEVFLLPWVGAPDQGIERGSAVPTFCVPDLQFTSVVAQSAVRLPLELCRQDQLERLITELEDGCEDKVGVWQESSVLAGSLVLFMQTCGHGTYTAKLCDRDVFYSREDGLKIFITS